jgi:hypothetical protein
MAVRVRLRHGLMRKAPGSLATVRGLGTDIEWRSTGRQSRVFHTLTMGGTYRHS